MVSKGNTIEIERNLFYSKEIIDRLINFLGETRVRKIFKKIKEPFRDYYLRVNTLKIDRDSLIEKLREKGIKVYKSKILEEAIYFKVEGPENLSEYEEKIKKYVIVDRYAAESVMLGADLYVPGIKRYTRFKRGELVKIYSPYGDLVGIGVAKYNSSEIVNMKEGLAIKVTKSLYKTPKLRDLEEYKKGYFYPQALSSMLVSRILNPEEGEKILDLCASPGGKTTHIAQLVNDKAFILAIDRDEKKVQKIKYNLERLGIKSVRTLVDDSRFLYKRIKEKFDKILLDPPCSSLGVRPKLFDYKSYKDFKNFQKYQRQFFRTAYELLKKDGILVYSTCTFTIEENEENMKYLLDKYKFEIEEIDKKYFIGENGFMIDENYNYEEFQRILIDKIDTTGFFIAKLRKK